MQRERTDRWKTLVDMRVGSGYASSTEKFSVCSRRQGTTSSVEESGYPERGASMSHSAHRFECWILALGMLGVVACSRADDAGAPDASPIPGDTVAADTALPDAGADVACVPDCHDRECGDDGCGGTCGHCAGGRMCSPQHLCVPDPNDCTETCASLGLECGTHCQETCGTCPGANDACVDGKCACQPTCTLASCGASDGCGGTCAPCPQDVSCAGCPLVLSVVERTESAGALRWVTLGLDYTAADGAEQPGLADLRLRVSGPAHLAGVALGEALVAADKQLFADPYSGQPFHVLADGTLQFLVLGTTGAKPIGSGHWLVVRFELPAPLPAGYDPLVVGLIKREQTLTPPSADQALWGAAIDTPVVVWEEAGE